MLIAPSGHVAPQHPQPLQAAMMTSAKPFSFFLSAPYGHTSMHVPHPVHLVSSTTDDSASACTYPLAMGMAALEAAADPWMTDSDMSAGPLQVPATYMPSVAKSTGLSFTCASRKKPSCPKGTLSIFDRSPASGCATSGVESTTMSTGMVLSSFSVSWKYVIFSWLSSMKTLGRWSTVYLTNLTLFSLALLYVSSCSTPYDMTSLLNTVTSILSDGPSLTSSASPSPSDPRPRLLRLRSSISSGAFFSTGILSIRVPSFSMTPSMPS